MQRGAAERGGATVGWFWIGLFVVVVIIAVSSQLKTQAANNEALGVGAGATYRTMGLNYLGGHPALPTGLKGCTLIVTAKGVAIEKGSQLPLRLPMKRVVALTVETEQEARQRYTATRMVTMGIFALAVPKKTAGSVLINVDTDQGPLIFEKEKASKASMLSALGPSIAAVSNSVSRRPAPAALQPPAERVGSVADELTKLASLRDSGVLSEAEFQSQKGLVLGGGVGPTPHPVAGEDDDDLFDLHLLDAGPRIINVIKAVREVTSLGLREAKELVEAAPTVLLAGASEEEVHFAQNRLQAAGATLQIKPT